MIAAMADILPIRGDAHQRRRGAFGTRPRLSGVRGSLPAGISLVIGRRRAG
jgi:hypothetical protein